MMRQTLMWMICNLLLGLTMLFYHGYWIFSSKPLTKAQPELLTPLPQTPALTEILKNTSYLSVSNDTENLEEKTVEVSLNDASSNTSLDLKTNKSVYASERGSKLQTNTTTLYKQNITTNGSKAGKASCPAVFANASQVLPDCRPVFNCTEGSSIIPYRVDLHEKTYKELYREHGLPKFPNATYSPCDCYQPSKIAIIVPYRDRDPHLRVFLNNIIPFLKFQKKRFRILVIEQAMPELFNRAALLNIGFLESQKLDDFDCFIFHDVDLIPENLCNSYVCHEHPWHLAYAMNKKNYNPFYDKYVGGVSSLTGKIMREINGFSNIMFGWGGEDDDIYNRVVMANYTWHRYHKSVARYTMIKHDRDDSNPTSGRTFRDAYSHWKYSKYDGLSSIQYTVLDFQLKPLYTHINVTINGPRNSTEAVEFFKETVKKMRYELINDAEERNRVIKTLRAMRRQNIRVKRNKLLASKKSNITEDKFLPPLQPNKN